MSDPIYVGGQVIVDEQYFRDLLVAAKKVESAAISLMDAKRELEELRTRCRQLEKNES